MDIDGIWKRIELLDDVLLRIFNECARLTLEFGHVKKELGLPVFDPAREMYIVKTNGIYRGLSQGTVCLRPESPPFHPEIAGFLRGVCSPDGSNC